MTGWAGLGEYRKRYVNDAEKAEMQAARRGDFQVALDTSAPSQAILAACTGPSEAFGALCPNPGGCDPGAACWRQVRRGVVILAAYVAVRQYRAGM